MESLSIAFTIIFSSIIYIYLHFKTHISLKFLYMDNVIVILSCLLILEFIFLTFDLAPSLILILIIPAIILFLSISLTMIRFWRTPNRSVFAKESEIVSPADGKIIYINRVAKGDIPVSIKGKKISKLEELIKTNLVNYPCWHIGINMTPFDVHKNCAPIDGKVIYNRHFCGKTLSLKNHASLTQNERNTIVIKNDNLLVGVTQIASRMVRRIDTYVTIGQYIKKGDWFGMIRFGSQVDLVLPAQSTIKVAVNQQVYAAKTIIASN